VDTENVRTVYAGLLLVTLWALARRDFHRQFPGFMAYLSVAFCASVAYAWGLPQSPGWWICHWLIWQPFLMVTLLASLAELLWRVSTRILPEERRRLLGLCGAMSFTMICMSFRVTDISTPVRLAAEIRRYADVGMTAALLTAVACFWIRPLPFSCSVVRHALILTAFVGTCTVGEIWPVTSGHGWQMADTVIYAACSACLVAWAILIRHERPARNGSPAETG
jgi:hypothetical protein